MGGGQAFFDADGEPAACAGRGLQERAGRATRAPPTRHRATRARSSSSHATATAPERTSSEAELGAATARTFTANETRRGLRARVAPQQSHPGLPGTSSPKLRGTHVKRRTRARRSRARMPTGMCGAAASRMAQRWRWRSRRRLARQHRLWRRRPRRLARSSGARGPHGGSRGGGARRWRRRPRCRARAHGDDAVARGPVLHHHTKVTASATSWCATHDGCALPSNASCSVASRARATRPRGSSPSTRASRSRRSRRLGHAEALVSVAVLARALVVVHAESLHREHGQVGATRARSASMSWPCPPAVPARRLRCHRRRQSRAARPRRACVDELVEQRHDRARGRAARSRRGPR